MPALSIPGATAKYLLQSPIDAAAVAPDGTRLSCDTTDGHRVHAFDLGQPNQPPNFFPEVGTSPPIDPPDGKPQRLITSDGGNVIVAGKDRLIAMPAS